MMALGSLAATSSISMPPAADAMKTLRPIDAVEHDAEVKLARDGQRLFDQQPLHGLAFGAGLMGDQLHAEHLGRQLAGFLRRLGELDAAALAAAAGMNLRFDDDAGGAVGKQAGAPRPAPLRGCRPSARAARLRHTSRRMAFP